MRRFSHLALSLVLLVFLVSCEVHRNLNVPGLADFEKSIKNEYVYTSKIRCILKNPTCYSVRCTLSEHVVPEKMTDLIVVLKDYALTTVLDAYHENVNADFNETIFLEFYVEGKYYFGYRYSTSGYDEPVWELE